MPFMDDHEAQVAETQRVMTEQVQDYLNESVIGTIGAVTILKAKRAICEMIAYRYEVPKAWVEVKLRWTLDGKGLVCDGFQIVPDELPPRG